MKLYEHIKEEKAVTSPIRRTPQPSIAVATETEAGSTLFPQATDRETEAQGGRIGSNSLGRKKAA